VAFVYILRCADGTFYVGHTNDLAFREDMHNAGVGATYTASRRPVEMVYAESHSSLNSAIRREKQLKRWTSEKKQR
jgi:putative endonuclease